MVSDGYMCLTSGCEPVIVGLGVKNVTREMMFVTATKTATSPAAALV